MAATATAIAGLSKRYNAEESDIAYMEKELGKKPANTNRYQTGGLSEKTGDNYFVVKDLIGILRRIDYSLVLAKKQPLVKQSIASE